MTTARLTLPPSRLLQHDLEYQAVYGARMKKAKGGVAVFVMPNGRAYHRLGLAVSKRGESAPARNRVKRVIREAFRHEQHELPRLSAADGGFDIVVSAGAASSGTLTLEAARGLLRELVGLACAGWEKRGKR